MNKRWLSLIGVAVFAIIILQLNISKVYETIAKANFLYLSAALALSIVMTLLKALKWKIIVETQGIFFPAKTALKGFLAGFALSLASPGRIGDFLRAFYVREKKASLVKGLVTVLIDRIIDITLLFALAILSLVYLSSIFENQIFKAFTICFLIVVIIALFLLSKKNNAKFVLKPLLNALVPEKHKDKLKNAFHEFYESLSSLYSKKASLAASVLIGLLCWIATFAFAFFVAKAIGIEINLLYLTAIVPLILIVEMVPISIAGLGTREATVVFFFSITGLATEQSIAFSLLFLFLGYLILGFFGAIILAKEPIRI